MGLGPEMMGGMQGPMPQGVPGGGLPPGMGPQGMTAPPANLGPHTIPQTNPGNIAQAMEKLSGAAQLINEAIPQIPIGTPLHAAILKVATELSKQMGEAKEKAQATAQTLMQSIAAARQNPQMAALQRMAPPNQPPAM